MTALAAPPSIGGNKTLMDTFLIDVPMPSMGATVNELTVVTLKIQPGARVTKGQKIGELESDKSVFEFESPCDGTVRSIQVHPGEARPSGATFLQIEKLAQEAGLDPAKMSDIEATGPGGRVSGDDVTRYIEKRRA